MTVSSTTFQGSIFILRCCLGKINQATKPSVFSFSHHIDIPDEPCTISNVDKASHPCLKTLNYNTLNVLANQFSPRFLRKKHNIFCPNCLIVHGPHDTVSKVQLMIAFVCITDGLGVCLDCIKLQDTPALLIPPLFHPTFAMKYIDDAFVAETFLTTSVKRTRSDVHLNQRCRPKCPATRRCEK